MANGQAEDAVSYFSDNAQHFHGLYRAQPEFHERLHLWHGLLDRYATPESVAFDMGCGSGVFSFYLAGRVQRVVGVDGADEMVAFCERQRIDFGLTNVAFVQARLPDVDEAALGKANLIISSSVVEYVDDLDATLALFNRLLAPRGVLILSMPNATSLSRSYQRLKYRLTRTPEIYGYIRHFASPRSLEQRVRPYGLTLLQAHHYTHFTRVAKMLHAARLPAALTEDLFVAAFQKR